METRYFVKFIGEQFVTLAVAHNDKEAATLLANQFEPTTEEFYHWLQEQTKQIA
ncbi:MAG: hypothetical protein IT320_26710 [Anaerolineae bacterium]|nr:hypothetical protein [Anaerolineae bacterium]